jgi:hypothetical protein
MVVAEQGNFENFESLDRMQCIDVLQSLKLITIWHG